MIPSLLKFLLSEAITDIINTCRTTIDLPYRSPDKFSFTQFPPEKSKIHLINLHTVLLTIFLTGENIDRNQIPQLQFYTSDD